MKAIDVAFVLLFVCAGWINLGDALRVILQVMLIAAVFLVPVSLYQFVLYIKDRKFIQQTSSCCNCRRTMTRRCSSSVVASIVEQASLSFSFVV